MYQQFVAVEDKHLKKDNDYYYKYNYYSVFFRFHYYFFYKQISIFFSLHLFFVKIQIVQLKVYSLPYGCEIGHAHSGGLCPHLKYNYFFELRYLIFF